MSEKGLRAFYSFRDFPHFIDVYTAVTRLLTGPQDIAGLIRGAARSLATQQVRYAEFHLVAGRDLGFSPAELAGLAASGVRASFLDAPAKQELLAQIAAVPLP